MKVKECTRCGSKIVESSYAQERWLTLSRQDGQNDYERRDAKLCSECEGAMFKWVFGEDTPDRSDTADPLPLQRVAENVEGHIESLEEILSVIREEYPDR